MENQLPQISLSVTEGLEVSVIQNPQHEFLISTKDVARGYGVAEASIRSHKLLHKEELLEGTHFIMHNNSSVEKTNARSNLQTKVIYWTKAGVIRLGMFIKSERAKLFRDWAEQIILTVTAPALTLPQAPRKKHNRLTQERLLDIMADVALINDKKLRMRIISKLLAE